MNIDTQAVIPLKKLILFDLDGVLLDSEDNMRRAWEVVQEQTGLETPFEAYFSNIGRPFQDILEIIGVDADRQLVERIYMTSSFDFLNSARFYQGTEQTLLEMARRGYRLGVVTSKDEPRTRAVLKQLKVNFASVQTPSGKYRGKPAPDYLMLAMAEAKCDPADTVYIGDMSTDEEAARRAGIDYLHAEWGYGENPGNSPAITSIEQLTMLFP